MSLYQLIVSILYMVVCAICALGSVGVDPDAFNTRRAAPRWWWPGRLRLIFSGMGKQACSRTSGHSASAPARPRPAATATHRPGAGLCALKLKGVMMDYVITKLTTGAVQILLRQRSQFDGRHPNLLTIWSKLNCSRWSQLPSLLIR